MTAVIAECPLCGGAKEEAATDLAAFVVHIRRCHNKALSEMRERCAKKADEFKPWALRECNVPWEVSQAIRNEVETLKVNAEQPVFIQTAMGFGCRICGRPPAGTGGCNVCQGKVGNGKDQ